MIIPPVYNVIGNVSYCLSGRIGGHNTDYRQVNTINGIMSPEFPKNSNKTDPRYIYAALTMSGLLQPSHSYPAS